MKMILNEYRLMPWQKEAQELVARHMEEFFFGESAALPPGYVPASRRSNQRDRRVASGQSIERGVRGAQRRNDRRRGLAAREDESRDSSRPSGSGTSNWSARAVTTIRHDSGDRLRLVEALDVPEPPRDAGSGSSSRPTRRRLAAESLERLADGVAEQQVLQRHTPRARRLETQRRRRRDRRSVAARPRGRTRQPR